MYQVYVIQRSGEKGNINIRRKTLRGDLMMFEKEVREREKEKRREGKRDDERRVGAGGEDRKTGGGGEERRTREKRGEEEKRGGGERGGEGRGESTWCSRAELVLAKDALPSLLLHQVALAGVIVSAHSLNHCPLGIVTYNNDRLPE